MFTGLVQLLGAIDRIREDQLRIIAPPLVPDLDVGDSIAVDGVCLTVTTITPDGFVADVSPETLRLTTLGSVTHAINLERSLRAGDKIGGHFVTGHIDGVGALVDQVMTGSAWELTFQAPNTVARYLVKKGSIAVNGISLTIASLGSGQGWDESLSTFQVAVIPHTYQATNLSLLQPGDPVNLEGDILGKYVEKLLSVPHSPSADPSQDLSLGFLAEHGYLGS